MHNGGEAGAENILHKTEMSTVPAISVEELWHSVIKKETRHGLLELSVSCPAWLNRTLVIGIFLASG
jgi:hypothetical protein